MNQRRRSGWALSLVTLLAIFGMALHGPMVAAAQESPAGDINFKDLDGYQRGVGRIWMGDISALLGGLGTPGAETPDINNLGLFMLIGMVAEFDNSDHASGAFGTLGDELTKSLASEDSGIALQESDGEKIGDQSKTYTGKVSEEGIEGQLTMVIVQKGKYVYASFGMGLGSDPSDAVNSLAKDLTDGKPGDGDGTFNDNGTSTGGLWDIFPSNDADYLKGLTPSTDEDLSQDSGE